MKEEILITNPRIGETLTLLKLKCIHMRREKIMATACTGIKEDVHMANFAESPECRFQDQCFRKSTCKFFHHDQSFLEQGRRRQSQF